MVCRLLLETGRGAAWLAHLLWEQRVAGSNPVAPTKKKSPSRQRGGLFCVWRGDRVRKEPRSGDAATAAPQGSTSVARGRSNPVVPTKDNPSRSRDGFFVSLRATGFVPSLRQDRLACEIGPPASKQVVLDPFGPSLVGTTRLG